jgi:diguanylate cyclase (GGDEF)-like protein
LHDEVTGLYNRRGFVQIGTRLLDVAGRDERPARLVYLCLDPAGATNEQAGPWRGDVVLRQVGNFMRDLFPSYGVYEVLGRLGGCEFAALTPVPDHVSRDAIMLRVRRREASSAAVALPLGVGVADFDPTHPVAIDELLHSAVQAAAVARAADIAHAADVAQAADVREPLPRIASPLGLPPNPERRFADGLGAAQL